MSTPTSEMGERQPADFSCQVWDLFDLVADRPPIEQQALLDNACAGDDGLRGEVERLLANDARLGATQGDNFLKSPLIRSRPISESVPSGEASKLTKLGQYSLIRLLGEGGMGAVYEANQDSPRRAVALKVIRPGTGLASASLLKRFKYESQILGRLHHPGIAQIFEAGVADDGQPYFAMELVCGLPLDSYARVRNLTLPARLELLARVCDAVQHAHDMGVIHRDLKPANILVEESGQPKVLDFGVARAIDADLLTAAGLTQTGQMLGTPNYMSPEQMSGDPAAIDHRADVYALGVILFELAAHRLPYRLENRPLVETARLILEVDPPRLGSIDPKLRGDVETIASKALEKDPARRYTSAADLAEDLRRSLANEPILARPPSALYHLSKFTRRHKGLVGGVVATVMALVMGLVGTILFASAEARQRGQAELNALTANTEKREAQYQTYRACLAAANAAIESHDVADAARHLQSAPEVLRGWEWRHLQSRLDDSFSLMQLPAGEESFLLVSHDKLEVGSWTSAGLQLEDTGTGNLRVLPIGQEHKYCVIEPLATGGLRIVSWTAKAIEILDDAGRNLCRVPLLENELLTTTTMSSDGARLAAAQNGSETRIIIYDAASGKQSAVCRGHSATVWAIAFSPDGSRLASGGEDRSVRLWNTATGTQLAICQGHSSKIVSVAFSRDGTRLVTASSDGTVRQWNAKTGQEAEPPYDRHSSEVYSAAYSPDGQWIASAGADRTVRVWHSRGRKDVAVLHGHTGRVAKVAFAPNSQNLASLSCRSLWVNSGDDTARVWSVNPVATLPTLQGHSKSINAMAYSSDERWLASSSWDGTVRLWDTATGEPCATLHHPSFVWGMAFGPDGIWMASGYSHDDRLRIWDVATASIRREMAFPDKHIHALSVSSDGTRFAVTGLDLKTRKKQMTVCNFASGEPLYSAEGSALAYSADGRWLATLAGDEKTVVLLNAITHETVATLPGHENNVSKAAFSRDGLLLATCSKDRTVRLWPMRGGECQVLRGHTDEVYAVAFHPDGTRLASGCQDGSVWLWDLTRGKDVVRLPGHKSFVWSLAFTRNGETLASGSGDATVRLWDTFPLKMRYQARREAKDLRPEAERLVEQLWREKQSLTEVVKSILADRVSSESMRHAALRAALRKAQSLVDAQDSPEKQR